MDPPTGIHNRKACKGLGQGLFERLRKIIYNPRTDAQPRKAELFTVNRTRVKMIVIEKISKGQRQAGVLGEGCWPEVRS